MTKNISGFVADGRMHVLKSRQGNKGDDACFYSIRIIENTFHVDGDGNIDGDILWRVIKHVGEEETVVPADTAPHMCQVKLSSALDWEDAYSNQLTNTWYVGDGYTDHNFEYYGSPSYVDIRFFIDDESIIFATLSVPIAVWGKRGAKGENGDAAVFDPETENILSNIANEVGLSTYIPISQKALLNKTYTIDVNYSNTNIDAYARYWRIIYDGDNYVYTWAGSNSANKKGKIISIAEYRDKLLIMKPQTGKKLEFAFVEAKGSAVGDEVSFTEDTGYASLMQLNEDESFTAIVPNNANWLYVRAEEVSSDGFVSPKVLMVATPVLDSVAALDDKIEIIHQDTEMVKAYYPAAIGQEYADYYNKPGADVAREIQIINGECYWKSSDHKGARIILDSLAGCTAVIKAQPDKDTTYAFVTALWDSEGPNQQEVSFANGGNETLHTLYHGQEVRVTIPSDAKYLYVLYKRGAYKDGAGGYTSINHSPTVKIINTVVKEFDEVHDEIDDIKGNIIATVREHPYDVIVDNTNHKEYGWTFCWGIIRNTGKWVSNSTNTGRTLDVYSLRGQNIRIKAQQTIEALYAFTIDSGNRSGRVPTSEAGLSVQYASGYIGLVEIPAGESVLVEVPNNANNLYVQAKRSTDIIIPEKVTIYNYVGKAVEDIVTSLNSLYVHVDYTNGDDANDGYILPVQTFNRAVEVSGGDVRIMLHGDTRDRFVLPSGKKSITLIGEPKKRNRIIRGEHFNTVEVSEGLYMIDISSLITRAETNISSSISPLNTLLNKDNYVNNYFLYKLDTPDNATAVSEEDRHPAYRGKSVRCDCLKIVPKDTLEEVITDITSADWEPAYYWDKDNDIVYLNISGSDMTPIVFPTTGSKGMCIYGTNCANIKISNIECLFGAAYMKDVTGIEVVDSAVKYVCSSGGWIWDDSTDVKFIRCEAGSITTGTKEIKGGKIMDGGGDGFNAHSTTMVTIDPSDEEEDPSVDPTAVALTNEEEELLNSNSTNLLSAEPTEAPLLPFETILQTAILQDCWAHDCNDDGFSDHYRSETNIIGGLFEYCGKGGITPSFGSQVTVKDAESRHNRGAGILYTGDAKSNYGRTGGCVTAYNCFCHDNEKSNYTVQGGSDSYHNIATFVNCISMDAGEYGYYSSNNKNIIRLVNCKDYNSTSGDMYNVIPLGE